MNPLFAILPAKARKYVYAGVALVGLIWTGYQAANGDWKAAVGAVVSVIVAGVAHANVTPDSSTDQNPPPTE